VAYKLSPCKVCRHPDFAKVDRLFLDKKITQAEAARRLDCSPAYYSTHINRDVRKKIIEEVTPAASELIVKTVDKIHEFRDILDGLINRCKTLLNSPLEEGLEYRIKAMSTEVRGFGEFLMKLEGDLTSSPLIQINTMNVKYNQLVETVMGTLCPVCRAKLLDELNVVAR